MKQVVYKCIACGYLTPDFNEGQCPICMTTDALEEDGQIEDEYDGVDEFEENFYYEE